MSKPYKCMECGKEITEKRAINKGTCPKCGSSDIDLNVNNYKTKK